MLVLRCRLSSSGIGCSYNFRGDREWWKARDIRKEGATLIPMDVSQN